MRPERAARAQVAALDVQLGTVAGLGRVWVEIDSAGAIVRLHVPDLDVDPLPMPARAGKLEPNIEKALRRYVAGDPRAFDGLKLAPAPSEFASKVRKVMQSIRWGEIMTYGQVAREIGKPGAARAVGQACGANPIPVIVPCHRVVSSQGEGGFGLGVEAKRTLMRIEGVELESVVAHGSSGRGCSQAPGKAAPRGKHASRPKR